MTSPNQFDDARFAMLVDLVLSGSQEGLPIDLSEAERREVERLGALFDAIDAAWQAPEAERTRVQALFLQKLAARHPGHAWVRTSSVQTLGELMRLDRDELPELPAESLALLERDPTPIERLLDPAQRSAMVGRAVKQARLPIAFLTAFMRWLNQALAQLSPTSSADAQGLHFTRPQRRTRKPSLSEPNDHD
ncbi:MAG: hypothetical protein ACLQUY_18890 [Ktedonobacterales bacterium]